jgi:hypothetical protein
VVCVQLVVPRHNLEALKQAAKSVKVPEGRQPITWVGVDTLWEALPYVFERKYRPRFVTIKATQADDTTIDGKNCDAWLRSFIVIWTFS